MLDLYQNEIHPTFEYEALTPYSAQIFSIASGAETIVVVCVTFFLCIWEVPGSFFQK
jgi:hypothetical protein